MTDLLLSPSRTVLRWRRLAAGAAILLAAPLLYSLSRENYLLFHGLVEVTGAVVAFTVFIIGWNTRFFNPAGPLQALAAGYLAVAVLSLLHLFAYRGMGIFPDGVDLPTQLWIATRVVEGVALLLATLLLGGRIGGLTAWRMLIFFLGLAVLLLLTIWPWGIFPVCLVEGVGLTPFKRGAEGIIIVALAVAVLIGYRRRSFLPGGAAPMLLGAVVLSMLSGVAFSLYADVYGLTNFLGHYLRLVSVLLVYRVLIQGALRDHYRVIFHDLASSREALALELEQRRRTEVELQSAYRELDAFVRTVSHDLRGPLTPIIGFSSHLREQLRGQGDAVVEGQLGAIETQGRRMLALLEDLLEFARIGHTTRAPQHVDVDGVVNEVLEELKAEIRTRGVAIELRACPPLFGQRSQVYQLFANLMRNAVRYGGRPGTTIVVGGTATVSGGRYYVSDQGPGIAAGMREKIFDAFYRGEDETTRAGSGLGLAIVEKVARCCRGRVWVEETPGGGSTFVVELVHADAAPSLGSTAEGASAQ